MRLTAFGAGTQALSEFTLWFLEIALPESAAGDVER
jgi:hypothetical protein